MLRIAAPDTVFLTMLSANGFDQCPEGGRYPLIQSHFILSCHPFKACRHSVGIRLNSARQPFVTILRIGSADSLEFSLIAPVSLRWKDLNHVLIKNEFLKMYHCYWCRHRTCHHAR